MPSAVEAARTASTQSLLRVTGITMTSLLDGDVQAPLAGNPLALVDHRTAGNCQCFVVRMATVDREYHLPWNGIAKIRPDSQMANGNEQMRIETKCNVVDGVDHASGPIHGVFSQYLRQGAGVPLLIGNHHHIAGGRLRTFDCANLDTFVLKN